MDFFSFEEYVLSCVNTKWTCIVSKFLDKQWTLNKSLFIGLQEEGYNKDLLGMKRQRTATGFLHTSGIQAWSAVFNCTALA